MYYENPDGVSAHTGFPNPAIDAALQGIDLNKLLIQNSAATYFMRITGSAWHKTGIFDGDVAVIDRAVPARPNDLIIWTNQDEFAVSPRHALPESAEVWGVVTAVIRQYRERL